MGSRNIDFYTAQHLVFPTEVRMGINLIFFKVYLIDCQYYNFEYNQSAR
jgi:hypothetical protein